MITELRSLPTAPGKYFIRESDKDFYFALITVGGLNPFLKITDIYYINKTTLKEPFLPETLIFSEILQLENLDLLKIVSDRPLQLENLVLLGFQSIGTLNPLVISASYTHQNLFKITLTQDQVVTDNWLVEEIDLINSVTLEISTIQTELQLNDVIRVLTNYEKTLFTLI